MGEKKIEEELDEAKELVSKIYENAVRKFTKYCDDCNASIQKEINDEKYEFANFVSSESDEIIHFIDEKLNHIKREKNNFSPFQNSYKRSSINLTYSRE